MKKLLSLLVVVGLLGLTTGCPDNTTKDKHKDKAPAIPKVGTGEKVPKMPVTPPAPKDTPPKDPKEAEKEKDTPPPKEKTPANGKDKAKEKDKSKEK